MYQCLDCDCTGQTCRVNKVWGICILSSFPSSPVATVYLPTVRPQLSEPGGLLAHAPLPYGLSLSCPYSVLTTTHPCSTVIYTYSLSLPHRPSLHSFRLKAIGTHLLTMSEIPVH